MLDSGRGKRSLLLLWVQKVSSRTKGLERRVSQRIAPSEMNLKHMVLHDVCFRDRLGVSFQPGGT